MEEKEKNSTAKGKDPEATLVTPRFDADATVTARPVVPLTEQATPERGVVVAAPWPATSSPSAVRRASWPLFLIVVSALAGGVLGVIGLHLYQQSQGASTTAHEEWEPIPEASPLPSPDAPSESSQAALPATTPTPPVSIIERAEESPIESVSAAAPAPAEPRREQPAAEPRRSPSPEPEARRAEAREGERTERREDREARRAARRSESEQAASVEEAPGPRRIDRIRDVMGGRPRRERPRSDAPRGGSIREIFEGSPPR